MSICQCLRVVERACKSQFVWRGTTRVQAAVYEFLLRDMAIRPLIDGVTELDPDEPAVPVTGLAFLCQQFVLLLRQRALDGEPASIGLEEATERLCQRVRSNDDKTVTFTHARLRRRPSRRAPSAAAPMPPLSPSPARARPRRRRRPRRLQQSVVRPRGRARAGAAARFACSRASYRALHAERRDGRCMRESRPHHACARTRSFLVPPTYPPTYSPLLRRHSSPRICSHEFVHTNCSRIALSICGGRCCGGCTM